MQANDDQIVTADTLPTAPPTAIRDSVVAGWGLLTATEKRSGAMLVCGVVVVSILETLGVGSVFPLVGLLVEPDMIKNNEWVARVWTYLGEPSTTVFIYLTCATSVGLLTASVFANLGIRYLTGMFCARAQARLALDLLTKCVDAPYPWFLRQNSAKLVRLFYADLSYWARGFVFRLMTIFNDIMLVIMIAVLVGIAAPAIGLGVMTAIGLLSVGLFLWVKPRLIRLTLIKRYAADDIMVTATQSIRGIKDIKLSASNQEFVRQHQKAYWAAAYAHTIRSIWQQIPTSFAVYLGQIGLLAIAVTLWMTGKTGGEIAAQIALLVLTFSRAVPAANRVTTGIGQLLDTFPYIDGIAQINSDINAELQNLPPVNKGGRPIPSDWNRLVFDHVDYQYSGANIPTLTDISLTLERGKSYGVIGPSGAGKTTLIDTMLCLLEPQAGQIRLDDMPLNDFDKTTWIRRIGYVPQAPFLTDDTLRANVAFGIPLDQIDDDRVRECLELACLSELLSGGVDRDLGEQGARLSGGQIQRLAIARALYGDPDVLVLDEATNALDPLNEKAIQTALENLHGKMTIIMIAHRMSTIRNCDWLFLIENGHLAAQGTFDDLERSNESFQQTLGAIGNHLTSASAAEALKAQ